MTEAKQTYSIIIIPDTQIIARRHPEKFEQMVNWLVQNKEAYNMQLALHVGDVVDEGNKNEDQFKFARHCLDQIVNANIPLMIVPGNHDYDNSLEENRNLEMYNHYFGVNFYQNKPWFGGVFEEGKSENMYGTVQAGGDKYVILALEFGPRDEVVEWADDILQQHTDHKAIILTHSFLYTTGERTKAGDNHHPRDYAGIMNANDGEELWSKCLARHANVFAVFSGHHVRGKGVSIRTDLGEHGNTVIQSYQNWQTTKEGGQGRIRLLTIDPAQKTGKLQVFNPDTNQFEHEPGYDESFSY